jgi:hypothetical protein
MFAQMKHKLTDSKFLFTLKDGKGTEQEIDLQHTHYSKTVTVTIRLVKSESNFKTLSFPDVPCSSKLKSIVEEVSEYTGDLPQTLYLFKN